MQTVECIVIIWTSGRNLIRAEAFVFMILFILQNETANTVLPHRAIRVGKVSPDLTSRQQKHNLATKLWWRWL